MTWSIVQRVAKGTTQLKSCGSRDVAANRRKGRRRKNSNSCMFFFGLMNQANIFFFCSSPQFGDEPRLFPVTRRKGDPHSGPIAAPLTLRAANDDVLSTHQCMKRGSESRTLLAVSRALVGL
jgi:hypothetical protein